MHFENTIDLSKNKKNYVTSIYYLEGQEEKTLDIYLQVNNVEKLEFTDQEETSKNNKIISFNTLEPTLEEVFLELTKEVSSNV